VLGQAGHSREATPFGTQGHKVTDALSKSSQSKLLLVLLKVFETSSQYRMLGMPRKGKISLLELVARSATLEAAWHAVRGRSNPKSRGFDDMTLMDFARSWPQQKTLIREQLLAQSYQFAPYLGHAIAKKSDADPCDPKSWRPISIATIRDRVVQRAILDRIWHDIRKRVYTNTSFGGIRRYAKPSKKQDAEPDEDARRCVRTAVGRIIELRSSGYSWVFETDIESFFPSIKRDRLFARLLPLLRDSSINDLIGACLDTSIANADQLGALSELWNPEMGVPQGGILSPVLANFYLYEHDKEMTDAGFKLVRYVDDLIVLTRSETEARNAYDLSRSILRRLELRIHPLGHDSNGRVKTNIHPPNEPFDFLGLTFASHSIRPTRKKFDSLKDKLLEITECKYSRMKLHEVIERLNWCVSGWVKAYDFCNLSRRELELIDCCVGDLVRRWLVYRGIIAKVNKLDARGFSWLGISRAQDIRINPLIGAREQRAPRTGDVKGKSEDAMLSLTVE
jgi:RNA-directed DNA polymerase